MGAMHTAKVRRRCRELHAEGLSYRAISREIGISYNSARSFALGYEPKNPQHPCPQCGEELRRRPESSASTKSDAWRCPECGAEFSRWQIMSKEQRARTQSRTIESVKRLRERRKQLIRDAKRGPCVDCGQRYPPPAMHLDHVRGEKLFILSTAIWEGRDDLAIKAEIAKCDLRCATCHALRHADD